MTVPVVGLTGGIASGKSTVARLFAEREVPVIDADQLAREVVAPGSEGLGAIVEAFGDGVLLADGSLDRKAVASRVFHDPALRKTLELITHPRIARLSAERLSAVAASVPYAMYEAPLLVESGAHRGLAALVVVALDPGVQVERVMGRDGLSRVEAENRLRAQYPLEKKLEVADFVIDNGGELAALDARVDEVHRALVARLQGGSR